ncbi:MAG: fumarate hydratase C-terminal domain-containing protein, partial [Actinomycetia bacterium]|nr:fumarate hydratase C-terminal domain-containing protein [Actinomycetes bacterium]
SLIKSGEIKNLNFSLQGSIIFHSAVSPAGVGPTSSNKLEIENNIPILSKAGVKIHLGKGALRRDTIDALNKYNSIYATVPPITALFASKIISKKIIAFPEEGMEAFHLLEVKGFPAIISAIHGKTLY